MENQVLNAKSNIYQSIVLRDDELWLSVNKVRNLEKFEKVAERTGLMESVTKMPLSKIKEISYNEASESLKLIYTNKKGKEKKMSLTFDDESESNYFAEYLGGKLNFSRFEEKENQIKPILTNVFFLLITILGTFLFSTMEDTSEFDDVSSRKDARNQALMKLIVETVGQTGVFIIGGMISVYLIYRIYSRYQNPANDVVLKR